MPDEAPVISVVVMSVFQVDRLYSSSLPLLDLSITFQTIQVTKELMLCQSITTATKLAWISIRQQKHQAFVAEYRSPECQRG